MSTRPRTHQVFLRWATRLYLQYCKRHVDKLKTSSMTTQPNIIIRISNSIQIMHGSECDTEI